MKKTFIVVLALSLMALVSGAARAQAGDPEFDESDYEFSFGYLVSSTPEMIIIDEYDYDTDEEVEVEYVVNDETRFEGIESLDDLQVDDEIEVLYEIIEEERIAVLIIAGETEEEDMDESEENSMSDGDVG